LRKDFIVNLESELVFSSFNHLLEPLPEFKSYLREVKLNTLLEGKKVEFAIDEISSGSWEFLGLLGKPENEEISITKFAFKIVSMNFIIKDDTVERLKVTIETMTTPNGKILKEIISNEIDLEIKVMKLEKRNKVVFYIDN